MKNLISMVDYCQQVSSEFMSPKKPFDKNEWFGKILNYSDFLKQPLELWMFIPCDECGNVLEIPSNDILYRAQFHNLTMDELNEYKNYQQAKERCLFDGFEIYGSTNEETDMSIGIFRIIHPFWHNLERGWFLAKGISTIEDLIKYNLQLTPTAIKQLQS